MNQDALLQRVVALDASARLAGGNGERAAVDVDAGALGAVLRALRDEPDLAFDMLLDHTAIDWPDENRIEVVYQLYSTARRHHLQVSTSVSREHPMLPTASAIWPVAEWQEREVYDLFGVLYDDHPDLRRILLEDDWEGFPLRKDYEDDFMLTEADT